MEIYAFELQSYLCISSEVHSSVPGSCKKHRMNKTHLSRVPFAENFRKVRAASNFNGKQFKTGSEALSFSPSFSNPTHHFCVPLETVSHLFIVRGY